MTIELIDGGGGGGGGTPPMPTYTWAGKPASYAIGQPVFISDAGAKGSHWFHDGATWKPIGGQAILATLGATSAGIGLTETLVFQYLIPANLWQAGEVLRLNASISKSGSTNTGVIRGHVGPLGTIADATVFTGSVLLAANRQYSFVADVRLDDPLTVQQMPSTNPVGYAINNTGLAGPTTLAASAVTTPLYFSLGVNSGGTDTANIMQAQLFLVGKAN